NCHSLLGNYAAALKLYEEALGLQKVKLGPDHIDTLRTMINLAATYKSLRRHAEALKLQEETLALQQAKLGPNHPETLTSLWNVAKDFINLDRGAEAVPLLDECLQRAVGQHVPGNFPEVADLRLRLSERAKDAAGCRATAELWEKQRHTDRDSLYKAAVCRAVTAAVLLETDKSSDAARQAKDETDRAMGWLHQAVAAGFI